MKHVPSSPGKQFRKLHTSSRNPGNCRGKHRDRGGHQKPAECVRRRGDPLHQIIQCERPQEQRDLRAVGHRGSRRCPAAECREKDPHAAAHQRGQKDADCGHRQIPDPDASVQKDGHKYRETAEQHDQDHRHCAHQLSEDDIGRGHPGRKDQVQSPPLPLSADASRGQRRHDRRDKGEQDPSQGTEDLQEGSVADLPGLVHLPEGHDDREHGDRREKTIEYREKHRQLSFSGGSPAFPLIYRIHHHCSGSPSLPKCLLSEGKTIPDCPAPA